MIYNTNAYGRNIPDDKFGLKTATAGKLRVNLQSSVFKISKVA
jgi:hypothetical protein